jgi:hypothetical protein
MCVCVCVCTYVNKVACSYIYIYIFTNGTKNISLYTIHFMCSEFTFPLSLQLTAKSRRLLQVRTVAQNLELYVEDTIQLSLSMDGRPYNINYPDLLVDFSSVCHLYLGLPTRLPSRHSVFILNMYCYIHRSDNMWNRTSLQINRYR